MGTRLKSITDADESRRRFLIHLLSIGAFAAIPGCASSPKVFQAMPIPEQMPESMSIFQYMGGITVNGVEADLKTTVSPGDLVETSDDSQMIFVVNKDAFLLRANTRLRIAASAVGGTYGLEKGGALSVFASRQTSIKTPSALISIRGTGVYAEVEPELSYVCVCYGTANLAASDDAAMSETIVSKHHDAPRYILADPKASNRIQPAPFKNHDDQDLLLIETLVGRTTPYAVPQGVKRTRGTYL